MTYLEMLAIVQAQLAVDLNCTVEDLNGWKGGFVFHEAKTNCGRRPFPRAESHFEMLSMGKAVVVSATPDLLAFVKEQIAGKSRDDAFSLPFVCGHSLYYLPDIGNIRPMPEISGFTYDVVERPDMEKAYRCSGFHNAVSYDLNHPRPDVLAMLAIKNGIVAGMAGASADCEKLWQVGIDVLPEYRCLGLAAYLTNRLAIEILRRGYVPYYGTASSNMASQKVAHRAGFMPAWICTYGSRFEGFITLPVG